MNKPPSIPSSSPEAVTAGKSGGERRDGQQGLGLQDDEKPALRLLGLALIVSAAVLAIVLYALTNVAPQNGGASNESVQPVKLK